MTDRLVIRSRANADIQRVGAVLAGRERGVLDRVMAVNAPSFGGQRTRILEDIATITGGRCIRQEQQDRLVDVTINDLGRARVPVACSRSGRRGPRR